MRYLRTFDDFNNIMIRKIAHSLHESHTFKKIILTENGFILYGQLLYIEYVLL